MATNLEQRLLRLERQQSANTRQQSAPVLAIYYCDADEGQPVGEPVLAYEASPQARNGPVARFAVVGVAP